MISEQDPGTKVARVRGARPSPIPVAARPTPHVQDLGPLSEEIRAYRAAWKRVVRLIAAPTQAPELAPAPVPVSARPVRRGPPSGDGISHDGVCWIARPRRDGVKVWLGRHATREAAEAALQAWRDRTGQEVVDG